MPANPVESSDETVSRVGVLAGVIAVSSWGLAGVVAKDIDMGGVAIGAYRFAIYGVIVGLLMMLRGSPITLHVMRSSMWGGIALGADVALFFSAIKLTSIANATVISAMQPVAVALIAWRVFGEQIRRRDITFGLLALAGVTVAVLASAEGADTSLEGDVLAGGAVLAWALYFVFSKQAKGVITSNEYTVGAALWVGLINVPIALAFGQSMAWPSGHSWVRLLALAFGAGVLGHSMMNWSIQQIPLWLGSTLTLLIPVVSAAAAWYFLDEPLTVVQITAMAVVLFALGGVITGQAGIGSRPRPLRR